MKDKYKDYSDECFSYSYPITWQKRNKEYLKKYYNRERKQCNKQDYFGQVRLFLTSNAERIILKTNDILYVLNKSKEDTYK